MRAIFYSILSLITLSASAQYKPTAYEAPPRMSIQQIDNRENSTLIFLDYTVPEDSTWNQGHQLLSFRDKSYLAVPSSDKKYRLLTSVNMPIDSEAEHKMMLFDRPGQRHQFVLEFEKLPDSVSSFNLVEDLNKPDANNITGITLNLNNSVPFVNIDRFIEDYPLKEYGQYYVKGTLVSYVAYGDIVVSAFADLINQYGKYTSVNVSVQNYRDNSILFDPDKLSAVGYYHPKRPKEKQKIKLSSGSAMDDPLYDEAPKPRKKEYSEEYDESILIPIDVELFTYEEFDKIVKKKQKWESFWKSLGEGLAAANAGYSSSSTYAFGRERSNASATACGNVGSTYGYAHAYGSSYTTAYAQSNTTSYNGLAAYAARQMANANVAAFKDNQRQIRQQIGEGYVKKHTIPSETEYSGFFNVKHDKKMKSLTFTLVIDGEPYTLYL